MKEVDSPSLNFNYSYTVIEGNLSIVPQIIRFNPGYPGMIQNRPLIAKSSFDIPIIIKQISSSDVRIFP